MHRIYKIVGVLLISGVLLTGIGSGVAFAEYSNFEYGEESTLEGSEYFTKTVEYKVAQNKAASEDERLDVELYYYSYSVVEDKDIPKDTIRFVIHYLSDKEDVNPQIIEQGGSSIFLSTDYQYEDMRDFMRVKDMILTDLKAHKISDYQMDGIKDIEICVNPDLAFELHVNGCDIFLER